MAAKRNTPKTQRRSSDDSHPGGVHWSDAFSYVLIGVAILVFLALISFSTADLPQWTGFNQHAEAASPAHNFIGPVGALIGLSLYLTLGAAAYFFPVGLIWLGILKLLGGSHVQHRILIGLGGILLATAALLDIFYKQESGLFYELIGSSGGFFGQLLGSNILQNLLGTVGAAIVLSVAYCVSLIFLTGFHPLQFFALLRRSLALRRQQALLRRQELESSPDEIPKPSRRSLLDSEPNQAPSPAISNDELPLDFPREVNIIDASVRSGSKKRGQPAKKRTPAPAKTQSTSAGFDEIAYPDYQLPSIDILDWDENSDRKPADKSALIKTQRTIIDTLATFGIEVSAGDITRGPTITRYEIYPGRGLRVGRIAALEADIARATRAERINIIAPIPGKDTVGIEIANNDKILVPLRELLEDPAFTNQKKRIPIALGKDVYGETIVGDLAAMPHLLVAGATGSGKSVCINSIIASILFRFSPDDLRFIMIDPKVVEMQDYNTLPHLVVPVVTDPKKVLLALRWVLNEMERRYRILSRVGARNFDSFNGRKKPEPVATPVPEESELVDEEGIDTLASALENGDITPPATGDLFEEEPIPDRLPYIVVIIDELADLMQTSPADVETAIARIAQKARAAGIHLIVATQTPRADVVTGIIKANIPTRIAFQVSSKIDSRVILDQSGADKLVGKGDMLYLPPGGSLLLRCQGALITDEEVHRLVHHCSNQGNQNFESSIQEAIENSDNQEESLTDEDEELMQKCIEVIAQEKRASTSLLQRRLRLGYTRAARMIDVLEQRGVIGPGEGAKPRDILVDLSEV